MALYQQLLERLRVVARACSRRRYAAVPILAGDEWDSSTSVEGHQAADGEDMQAFMNALSPGYFETMGIPMLEGRDFTIARRQGEQPRWRSSIAASPSTSSRASSAVGKHLGRGAGPKTKLDIEIIGVVADSLYEGPREGVRRQVFVPNWGKNSAVFYVRTHERLGRRLQPGAQRGEAARCGDAGLRDEDTRGAARRDAADRPADRAAVGRLRPAGDAARVDRALRRDGVRGGAAARRSSASGWRSARSRRW